MSARAFFMKLTDRGFEKRAKTKGAYYFGIGIKKNDPPVTPTSSVIDMKRDKLSASSRRELIRQKIREKNEATIMVS
jgi:hypothetical protein